MADKDPDDIEPKTTDPTDDPAKVADPAPAVASAEEVASLKASLAELRSLLSDSMNRQPAPAAPAKPAEPVIEDVSDDELDAIIAEGKPGAAKVVRKAANAAIQRELKALRQEIAELRQYGVSSLNEIGELVAQPKLKYKSHPVLGPIIEREIKEYEKYDPRVRSQPKVLSAIHNRVVGEHIEELANERTEAAIRKARETPGGSTPTDVTGRDKGGGEKGKTPTVSELLGEEAQIALNERGVTADEYYRRMGYKGGWTEYAEMVQKQRGVV